MTGIARTRGTAPSQRSPLTAEQLRAALAALPATVAGIRDRALLLVGWNLALRRSALVALDVADVAVEPWGAVVTIRRDKTDQLGAGRQIPLHRHGNAELCPVAALQAWLAVSRLAEGAIFRGVDRKGRVGSSRLTDRSVALIVKAAVERVGLSAERYAGHSLRSGVVTSAAQAGRGLDDIMALTGHRSVAVARGYIRRATVRDVGAARGLL
jgi:integrase